MLHFLYFWGLNFIFSSFKDAFVNRVERWKVKKILYDKYILMLTIRNNQVDNYFSDKFISLCHVDYFTNDDRWKVNSQLYLSHFLHFSKLNFIFLSFKNTLLYSRIKMTITQLIILFCFQWLIINCFSFGDYTW